MHESRPGKRTTHLEACEVRTSYQSLIFFGFFLDVSGLRLKCHPEPRWPDSPPSFFYFIFLAKADSRDNAKER
jgi:hypothetical protein